MSKETCKKWWHPLMSNRLRRVLPPGILARIRRAKDRRDCAAFLRKQWETAGDPRTREDRAREARMERMGVDLASDPDRHIEGFWIEESHDVAEELRMRFFARLQKAEKDHGMLVVRECTICGISVGYRSDHYYSAIILDSSCGCGERDSGIHGQLTSWIDIEDNQRRYEGGDGA